jgi:hypothetical protein
MSPDDVQPDEEGAEGAEATEATEANAGDAGDAEAAGGEDSAVADNVDGLANEHMSDSKPSPQPEGVQGDPIGDAEQHIASLDMEAERKKASDLMKDL